MSSTLAMKNRARRIALKRERQSAKLANAVDVWRKDLQDMAPYPLPTDTVLRTDSDFDAFERDILGDDD